MYRIFLHVSLMVVLVSSCRWSERGVADWQPLLDKRLSKWETYLSYRHTEGFQGQELKDEDGKPLPPIGYGKNIHGVFSISLEEGLPVLRVSGEIYGCIFTKREYHNYHLKLKVKWGSQKWVPRLNDPMDSGILYHSQGKCGVDYWRSWMLSQEFQIIENSMGDYWSISSSQMDVPASMVAESDHHRFYPSAKPLSFGVGTGNPNFCQAALHVEKPMGDWNELELICFEDKSIHIVNGQVVMVLENSRFQKDGKSYPLVKGKIQLQSEAAEVFFKEIYLRPISGIPNGYQDYFSH